MQTSMVKGCEKLSCYKAEMGTSILTAKSDNFQTSLTKSTVFSDNHLLCPAHFVILYCLLKLKWNNVENYVSTDIALLILYNPSSRTVIRFITKEINT